VKSNQVPSLVLDSGRESLVSSSGALLLRETIAAAGLGRDLSTALSPWRRGRALHDPGKVLLDVATAVALGGDCLADLAAVRAQPAVFEPVASDPTVSRVFAALAADADAATAAIRGARARSLASVWARRRPLAGAPGARDGGQVIVDIDATWSPRTPTRRAPSPPSNSVAATGPTDPDPLGDQVLQPRPRRELQDRCQPSARHEVGVAEGVLLGRGHGRGSGQHR